MLLASMKYASSPSPSPLNAGYTGYFLEPSSTKCVYEIEVDSDLREIMIVDKDIQDAVNSAAMNRYAKILL